MWSNGTILLFVVYFWRRGRSSPFGGIVHHSGVVIWRWQSHGDRDLYQFNYQKHNESKCTATNACFADEYMCVRLCIVNIDFMIEC